MALIFFKNLNDEQTVNSQYISYNKWHAAALVLIFVPVFIWTMCKMVPEFMFWRVLHLLFGRFGRLFLVVVIFIYIFIYLFWQGGLEDAELNIKQIKFLK